MLRRFFSLPSSRARGLGRRIKRVAQLPHLLYYTIRTVGQTRDDRYDHIQWRTNACARPARGSGADAVRARSDIAGRVTGAAPRGNEVRCPQQLSRGWRSAHPPVQMAIEGRSLLLAKSEFAARLGTLIRETGLRRETPGKYTVLRRTRMS